mmetsp:Transcript_93716/g.260909  ORF Transcript_93716/g.260909 Transcript_93716/m.260909 type:complete len:133 (+) Transcript_93716:100-498(+)
MARAARHGAALSILVALLLAPAQGVAWSWSDWWPFGSWGSSSKKTVHQDAHAGLAHGRNTSEPSMVGSTRHARKQGNVVSVTLQSELQTALTEKDAHLHDHLPVSAASVEVLRSRATGRSLHRAGNVKGASG